jgi:hypothetical protein
MYLQEILEVGIGLVFVWLVISIGTMSLHEWMSNIANSRARGLERAISQMLSSPEFTRKFYEYPLIANLYQQPKKKGLKARLPSYIPAEKFGATLFDLIIQAGADYSPVQSMTIQIDPQINSLASPEQQKLAREDWQAILEMAKSVANSGASTAALDSLKFQVQAYGDKYPELKPSMETLIPQLDAYYGQFVSEQRSAAENGVDSELSMRQLRLGLRGLQKTNPRLSSSVTSIIRQGEVMSLRGEMLVVKTRTNLESWFNDAMSRISGSYKRHAQLMAFIIGVFLALLLNVDSINVATSLWREPTLRQAIIAEAQGYIPPPGALTGSTPSPLHDIPALKTELQALNIPFGWTFSAFETGSRQCSMVPILPGQVWGIPGQNASGQPTCNAITNLPADPYGWLVKLLGLLITGMAAAQGAPFWFDILKKLVNVRGTGANPQEQQAVG